MSDKTENDNETVISNVIDIRDRLPPHIFGTDPSGNMAVAILEAIIKQNEGAPHVWFAGLMTASCTLQRLLAHDHNIDQDKLRAIFAKAMEIADSMQINIDIKSTPPERGG